MGAWHKSVLICGIAAAISCAPGLVRAQADIPTASSAGVALDPPEVEAAIALEERSTDAPDAPDVAEPIVPAPLVASSPLAPAASPRPEPRDLWAVPVAHWDGHPQGPRWTAAVLSALRGPGAPLLDVVPRDIGAWCPGYLNAAPSQRAAFWTGLISTLAWHESSHRADAVGGGGQWFGLVQIAPGTARWRRCDVRTAQALREGPANLRCAIRIMAATVPRDGVVAEGRRGVAADWGPFHSTRKREEMRNWVRRQDYCLPPTRPVMRPMGLARGAEDQRALVPVSGPRIEPALRPTPRP